MSAFLPREDCIGLSHLDVVVPDIGIATELYAEALGFEPPMQTEGPMEFLRLEPPVFARIPHSALAR